MTTQVAIISHCNSNINSTQLKKENIQMSRHFNGQRPIDTTDWYFADKELWLYRNLDSFWGELGFDSRLILTRLKIFDLDLKRLEVRLVLTRLDFVFALLTIHLRLVWKQRSASASTDLKLDLLRTWLELVLTTSQNQSWTFQNWFKNCLVKTRDLSELTWDLSSRNWHLS